MLWLNIFYFQVTAHFSGCFENCFEAVLLTVKTTFHGRKRKTTEDFARVFQQHDFVGKKYCDFTKK